MNELYFGDNLAILREHIKDESVDLVYLDPPFNSAATYNKLFKSPTGDHSRAQIAAFEDTWQWGEQADEEFEDLRSRASPKVSEMMLALKRFLGENDVMAYLTMMASRLLELRRVLKPTGSLYLHCDPTASHYLKIVLDGVFGLENFRSEVVWKRTSAHSSAKRYGPVHDVLLFYSRGQAQRWNQLYQPYDQTYLDEFYTHLDDNGRRWRRSDLTGAGTRRGETGNAWRGIDITAKGRHWAYPPSVLSKLDRQGKIHWPAKAGGMPMLKRYLDEQPGVPLQDVWTDIRPMHNLSDERLGYQTQKPLALLDRIIQASSNPGDLVLDPFCGCGTAIESAHRLGRRWIGIDITNLAIDLVEDRLRRAFPNIQHVKVNGRPRDMDGARELAQRDRHEFEYWICSVVDARPFREKRKGADTGIDGMTYFVDDAKQTQKVLLSVKSGENVSVQMIRDLRGVLERERAAIAWFVTLAEPTKPMEEEARKAGFYVTGRERLRRIQIITVEGLLNGSERALHPGASLGPRRMRTGRAGMDSGRQGELFAAQAGRRAGEVVDMLSSARPPDATRAPARRSVPHLPKKSVRKRA
jgi:site-specific DNA-methyltransferase (adenine-specific)